MTKSEICLRAYHLIQKGWAKDVCATTVSGDKTYITDPAAASFCLYGALTRAVRGPMTAGFSPPYDQCPEVDWTESFLSSAFSLKTGVVGFNDLAGRTKTEVLELLAVGGWLASELGV